MGTFHGTPYSGLPIVVRDYFLTVYTENGGDLRTEGYADVAHIHTSPCWTTPTTAWIIPLVVHVPFTELQTRHEIAVNIDGEEEKLCTFVNNNSMDHLERYHNMALQHFNSAIKTEKSRKKVARKLFDQTNILDLFEEDFRSTRSSPSKADSAPTWRSSKPSVRGRLGGLFAPKDASTGPKSTTSGEAAAASPLRESASPPEIVLTKYRSDIDDRSWRRGCTTPLDTMPSPSDAHLAPVLTEPTSRTRAKKSAGKRSPSASSSIRSAGSFLKKFTSRRSNTSSTRSQANTDDPSLSRGSLRDQGA
ncbi:hypothetical protein GGG16DRAFT_118896 [Schizophyllum commune]